MSATDRLDAIDARVAAATEGPWFRRANDLIGGECVMPIDAPPSSGVPEVADFVLPADAEFIAHARTDIPDLTAAIRAGIAQAAAEIKNAGKAYAAEPYDIRAALMASAREDVARAILRAITARLGDA